MYDMYDKERAVISGEGAQVSTLMLEMWLTP